MTKIFRKALKNKIYFVLVSILLLAGCESQVAEDPTISQIDQFIESQDIDKTYQDWKRKLNKPPQLEFTEGKRYLWDMQTNHGLLTLELWPQHAPMHVSSTIYLTRLGFYDGITFHRVIRGFMAQGGDPMEAGIGNPGYLYEGEFSEHAVHDRAGILSMANAGPGTDGSQFFITFKPTPHLDGRHTVFGEVVAGEEVLKTIELLGSFSGQTSQPVTIEQARIRIEQ